MHTKLSPSFITRSAFLFPLFLFALGGLAGCGRKEQPLPANSPASAAKQAPPAKSETEDHGTLVVDLKVKDPTAIVSIDGNDYMPKELGQPLALPAGEHTVLLKLDGKAAKTRKLTLEKGKRLVLPIGETSREAAEWVVKAGGSARIQIGGQERDAKNITDLPPENFNLVSIDLYGKPVTDADLERLEGLTALSRIGLARTAVTDVGVARLAGLTALENVDLSGTKITDTACTHLSGLPKLAHLFLADTDITDSGMARLKDLRELHNVILNGTKITDAALAHLSDKSNLRYLHVAHTGIGDDGLTHLRGLDLPSLTLDHTRVTDAGLANVAKIKVRRLSLSGTSVSDKGLQQLSGLDLQALWLEKMQITDAGLLHLKKLPNLQMLDIKETGITDAGITDLKRALPKCNVTK